ncbi:MAG: electron transport complex subunit RsxA [Clostridia bacterium]|nr:electron transport complex subunit RsxA [Clostridia bacterium]
MTEITRILLFMVGCVFTQNIVFARLLGAESFRKSCRVETAAVYGLAVTLAMVLASVCFWIVDSLLLVPAKLTHFRWIAAMLVVIVAAWLVGQCVSKAKPAWAEALGNDFMPIAANCAVLGVAVLNVENAYNFGYALLNGLCGGVGFLIAIVLMAGVQDRLETSKVPESFKGLPISLISASLIALAFIGFKGMA